jgi:murein DD-endopeptidase MepM/ murein hydrolase activator NlpD
VRLRCALITAILLSWLASCQGGAPPSLVETPLPPRATAYPTTAPPTTTPVSSPTPSLQPATPSPRPTETAVPTATPTPTLKILLHIFPIQPPEEAYYVHYHHDYPANDILCPVGTSFVAVTDGVIDEVSYDDRWDAAVDDPALRGGRFVSLIGDDGARYYGSHLSAVVPGLAPGVRVAAGQLLGYVGTSGDAAGTAPHLHFGISHPTFPGDWSVRRGEIDPYPYLVAWQQGVNVTPDLGPAASVTPTSTSGATAPLGPDATSWNIGYSAHRRLSLWAG